MNHAPLRSKSFIEMDKTLVFCGCIVLLRIVDDSFVNGNAINRFNKIFNASHEIRELVRNISDQMSRHAEQSAKNVMNGDVEYVSAYDSRNNRMEGSKLNSIFEMVQTVTIFSETFSNYISLKWWIAFVVSRFYKLLAICWCHCCPEETDLGRGK